MKKFVLILAALLLLCSCGKEIPEKPEKPEDVPVFEETNPGESCSLPEDSSERKFYPAAGSYMYYGREYVFGKTEWNSDNTLTFQHENTINILSSENELLETVTLPEEHLPEFGYELSWNDKYILAAGKDTGACRNEFGVVYYTEDGRAFLANVSLFDRAGNLIREYHKGRVYGYGENGSYEVYLPVPEGSEYKMYSRIEENRDQIFWIDDDKAIFECRHFVVYYDFSKDEGRIIDDMSEFREKYGKFSVYYGVASTNCGVFDGKFYYLAHKDDEKSNTAGTIWRADENGTEQLFEGKEFVTLFIGREIMVAVEEIGGDMYENGCVIYAIYPENPVLKEIYRGDAPDFPIGDDGQIRFIKSDGDLQRTLYSYDYKTGKQTEEPGNLSFVVESIVPGYWDYIMKSDDGKFFVEYDPESEEPRLRILPFE